MDNGPSEYAAEHASAVAREVVRLGLADVDPVRRCFQEYGDLLRLHGPRGTFTQLLLVRGLVDRGGFDKLQTAVPPDPTRLQGSGSAQSQVFRIAPGLLQAGNATSQVAVLGRPASASPASSPKKPTDKAPDAAERTLEFGAVLDSADPDAEESGGRTMSFAAVLPAPDKVGSVEDAIGAGLGSSDELELPPSAPTPARPRPPSGRPTAVQPPVTRGKTPPSSPSKPSAGSAGSAGSKASSASSRSTRTPDPVAREDTISMRDDEVLPIMPSEDTVSMRDDDVLPVPPTVKKIQTTAGSRTPGTLGEALDLVPTEERAPGGYQLDGASQDDASGKDFYMSDENEKPGGGATAAAEPQPGQVLGGHELVKVLGRGGMGVIYVAKKQGQAQHVALKVLLGTNDAGADRRRQRFRAEFEALRRLEHPSIVRVFDFGREGPFDWYTMELVEGQDFEKLLAEGGMEPQEKLDVYGEILVALGHAHERNVVHRDVKPQNVLVDAKGHAHVLDFGLAKILDQGVGMTRTGSSLGTPFYMAPEQLKSAKHVDARADVFALGVMLYEIVTGQRPFPGETAAEVGHRILNDDPARPSKVKKGVHPDLDAICLRALEKEAERRYANAAALHEDFVRFRKGLGVQGAKGAQGAAADVRRWAVRNRAGIIGGLVASGLLVPGFIVLAAIRGGSDPGKATESPAVTDTGTTPTDAPTPVTEKRTGSSPQGSTTTPPPTTTPTPTTSQSPPPTPTPTTTTRPPTTTTTTPPPPPPPTTTQTAPAPRSPVEVARAALGIPDERAGISGADQAQQAHGTVALQRTLFFAFEHGVAAPMAIGETGRALEGLRALRATPGLQVTELAPEIERDAETLDRLRALLGARLADGARGRSLEVYGGERLRVQPGAVQEGGWVRLGDSGLLDPLALDLTNLHAIAVDPKVDHPPTRYALAVLALYRGVAGPALEADLAAAGAAPAAERRRKLAAWFEGARKAVWQAYEAEAEDMWRDLQSGRRKDGELLKDLEAYVEKHGRTTAFRQRHHEWQQVVGQKRPWTALIGGAQRGGQPQITWKPLRLGDGALDFEVAPVKDDRPFRAEAQSAAVSLENGRIAFELEDLVGSTAEVEVASNKGPLAAFFGPMLQEVDADTAWTVKIDGRQAGQDVRRRPLTPARSLVFERNDTHRLFRIASAKIEVPLANANGRWGGALGAQAETDLRVSEVLLTWKDEENTIARAKQLGRRLVERDLLRRLVDPIARDGHVLARLDVARPTAVTLDGAWEAQGGALTAGQGASLRAAAWAEVGVLRFELAADDGPGVRLWLRAPTGGGGGASWLLPGLVQPDPTRLRQVTVHFDLKAKAVVVLIDGLRLRNPSVQNLPAQGMFGLEVLGRTKVRLKSLELSQLGPRSGLKP